MRVFMTRTQKHHWLRLKFVVMSLGKKTPAKKKVNASSKPKKALKTKKKGAKSQKSGEEYTILD